MAPFHKNWDKAYPEHNLHQALGSQFRNDITMLHCNQSVFYQSSISNIIPRRHSTGIQKLLWHYWRSRIHSCCCWCLFSHHTHTALCWKAGSSVQSPTLTVGLDNATCSDCKFLRSLCWGIWVCSQFSPGKHHNTMKSHKSSGKGADRLSKSRRWGQTFFQFIPLLSAHSTAEETQWDPEHLTGEFGGCCSPKSLAKPSLPCPTWVPSSAIVQLWQVLAGFAPAAPPACCWHR